MRKTPPRILLALLIASFSMPPAFADKPSWAGQGNPHGHGYDSREMEHGGSPDGRDSRNHKEYRKHSRERANVHVGAYFDEPKRHVIRDYYGAEFHAGRCPPGLAKKHNGCMPPGQAKQWALGHPLPRSVVFYAVPPVLVTRIGPPPAGYRYVRVASDILLIAVGTGMVVDAIEDIGNL